MKRTIRPPVVGKMCRMVNYFDEARRQRWGRMVTEQSAHVVVIDILGDMVTVSKRDVIKEEERHIESVHTLLK